MTVDALLEAAKKLAPDDRIRLAEQVWDSVTEEELPITLPPEQEAELNRRLDRLQREGPSGVPWEALRQELRGQAGR
jgi:putative addiction module component (TIGR02574 family)